MYIGGVVVFFLIVGLYIIGRKVEAISDDVREIKNYLDKMYENDIDIEEYDD